MPKGKSSKSTKQNKDPKAPKRHRSGYILFTIEKRSQIKTENPGLNPKEILAELGAQWSSADPQTKQHYQKLADAEKAEYTAKSNAYKNENENSKKGKQNQSMEVNSSQ